MTSPETYTVFYDGVRLIRKRNDKKKMTVILCLHDTCTNLRTKMRITIRYRYRSELVPVRHMST